jgi:DNA replication factor GINS
MDGNGLKNVLRDEGSSTLKSLHPGFYKDVEKYLKELEEEIFKIDNPRSVESKMLDNELQSAITDIEVIFIRRIRKIISYATNNAFSSMPPSQDMSKLLPEEKKVYDAVLTAINSARAELLVPILDPQAAESKSKKEASENSKVDTSTITEEIEDTNDVDRPEHMDADIQSGTSNKDEIGKSNINKEFVVVRILEDLPTFKAMDNRNYTLHAEDVVVLPALNVKGLIKRNVAQMIL